MIINERPADGPRCSAQTNSGFLVAVEGGDGVGKTTIARLIGASTESEIEFLSKQHVPPEPSFAHDRMYALSNTLWPGGTIPNGAELPGQYWEGLQTAWYSMAAEFVFGPRLSSGTSIIADGLYYKFCAKRMEEGLSLEEALTPFHRTIVPNRVILLRADPSETVKRRDYLPHETGSYGRGGGGANRAGYIHHQERLATHLTSMASTLGWTVIDLEPCEKPAETAARVWASLQTTTAASGGTGGRGSG